MNKKKKEIIGIAVFCVLILVGMFYVHTLDKKIDRPGIACPKCSSPETLVLERVNDGSVRCMCYDCKTHFVILVDSDIIDENAFDPGCYDPAYDGPLDADTIDADEEQLLKDEEEAYAKIRR